LLDRGGVGLAAAELLEALAVGLPVGDEANPGAGSGSLNHSLGQLLDRDLPRRADIEGPAHGPFRFGDGDDRLDRVIDVGEAARLGAVAVDRQVVALQGLRDEAGQDHAVGAELSRPDRVEEPDDDCARILLARVAEGEHLAERLRGGVPPA
jgi:hypothetical protein